MQVLIPLITSTLLAVAQSSLVRTHGRIYSHLLVFIADDDRRHLAAGKGTHMPALGN